MTSYSELKSSSAFEGENANYLEALYEQYLLNPDSVSKEWQNYFSSHFSNEKSVLSHSAVKQYFLNRPKFSPSNVSGNSSAGIQQSKVDKLIAAYRRWGHLAAKTNPLRMNELASLVLPDVLSLNYYGLNLSDTTEYDANGLAGLKKADLKKIVSLCQQIYCSGVGFEYQYIDDLEELAWLQDHIEKFKDWQLTKTQKINFLNQLTAAEGLEKALAAKYSGVTRFSLEGGDSQIPLLNHLIQFSANLGVQEIVVGMAHRGRLNVLVNVLGMPSQNIFAMFDGTYPHPEGYSEDVKYHYGYSADLPTENGAVHVSLGFNPSHLEIVSPVIQGSVRARQDRREDNQHDQVLGVFIHGDAAFIGQGIVMETFNLSQTRAFTVGGSFHLVINNQVGFTTSNPADSRSTRYCTDIAKMVEAPIFHVNSDDPDAIIFVTELAVAYRQKFHKDVVIDLVCYRRLGHNEGDEPAATQPLMYQFIKKLPSVRQFYAEKLIKEQVLTEAEVSEMLTAYRKALDEQKILLPHVANPAYQKLLPDWSLYTHTSWETNVKTALDKKIFEKIASQITALPENFKLQAQVARIYQNRTLAYEGKTPLIWGDAELLAYASLLVSGYPVRLVGQDSGRGTFAHRHGIVYDQNTGQAYCTLSHLTQNQAKFSLFDSVLSENAVMAFECGYAGTQPQALVLWEAQYGDFVNGAQVVIDQFLSSSEQKWQRYCGLVLLLPHGYEGAGPEHSSARLERFLQLCAQDNMQVCIPTTPAQLFHVLRRQILRPYRKPLIILSPKGLLRKATSELSEIFEGSFKLVIPASEGGIKKVTRVILCSGRVYYDLIEHQETAGLKNTAIIRIEQLYPFPADELKKALLPYEHIQKIIWCQEEPKNQGAWLAIRAELENCLTNKQILQYVGRPEAASTAAGYKKLHEKEREAFLQQAFLEG